MVVWHSTAGSAGQPRWCHFCRNQRENVQSSAPSLLCPAARQPNISLTSVNSSQPCIPHPPHFAAPPALPSSEPPQQQDPNEEKCWKPVME